MRSGEALVPMTADRLKAIFDEGAADFSAEICTSASMSDLDPNAIDHFRRMWAKKAGNQGILGRADDQVLVDAELMLDGYLRYAALILFGSHQALGRYLSQAEVVFEYRASVASGPATYRAEYRQGFFLFQDALWETINLRNERQHFQSGFFVFDVPTFNEVVVREAILNAVSHRDYRLSGSVFVRQFPRSLEVVSPGGFPPGINTGNILWRQAPRNRRIAEAFDRCGLVERSGQGMNRIFEECIKESKATPDFNGTDDYQVAIALEGEVQDPKFLRFLEQVGRERLASYDTRDFLVLDCIHQERPVPDEFRARLPRLINQGVIERVGHGRGSRYTLSRRFYDYLGQQGTYTRRQGLDRETNKMLLLKHIQNSRKEGCQLKELVQVLPALSKGEVQTLMRELQSDGQIHHVGRTKAARWLPGPKPD